MRIGKTLPPAAAPLELREILSGFVGLFTGGRAATRFVEELKDFYQVPHVFLVCSGKTALTIILQALKEMNPDRDEVLIPAYTCYSVPAAIIKAGLRVRICDIDPATLDFDWGCLEGQLDSPRLLCVISTHLFGLPADVDRVRRLAAGRGLTVIEDAAQAMGGEVGGRKIGTLGDVALFSLGRGKALSTVSGGVILTGSDRLAGALGKLVAALPKQGFSAGVRSCCYALALSILVNPHFYWLPKALPFLKLGETTFDPDFGMHGIGSFQAGLARGWQKKVVRLRGARLSNAMALIDAGIASPAYASSDLPNIIKLPVLVKDSKVRSELLEQSERGGLGISRVYPEAINGIPELKDCLLGGDCPQAELVAKSLLSLPVHPFVTKRDIRDIIELFGKTGELGNGLDKDR
jgi:perosamine synthetase